MLIEFESLEPVVFLQHLDYPTGRRTSDEPAPRPPSPTARDGIQTRKPKSVVQLRCMCAERQ